MEKVRVANGVWWVDIPEADLRVLCGCPADSVKHLIKRGLISELDLDGLTSQTGPNAILLSDVALQGGEFANLAEFPVMQMLYRQGLGVPGHPRNDGTRPFLIGLEPQVRAQSRYIMRGTYGLPSATELEQAGAPAELVKTIMRMKLHFAFGRILDTRELLNLRVVGTRAIVLRRGAYVKRQGFNVYEFTRGSSSVTVDLNLAPGERYEPSYSLPPRQISLGYFSVVHLGEGDGWNADKPCMGSLIVFQGKVYLVDAGPHILDSLTALGISVNEVEGIFQTHSHDDHFAGLTSLVRSDHRIRYFAAPAVRASVAKKLSTLMGFNEKRFGRYFEVVDLGLDAWNDVDGLEVRPVLSAHPVETTVLFFRAFGAEGPAVYAHLADIPSLDVLRSLVTEDETAPGVSPAFAERLERELLARVELKKIDAGGGAIHGSALDFRKDESSRIIVSHASGALTDAQKQVGSSVAFGQEDVLIAGTEDYGLDAAFRHLRSYFPTSLHLVRMLVNCPRARFAPGSLILRKDAWHEELYIIIRGIVEFIDADQGIHGAMGAGSMIGEYSALHRINAIRTFRAVSEVLALRVPTALYEEFLRRSGLAEETRRVLDNRQFLQDTWLFGEMISFPLLRTLAKSGKVVSLVGGQLPAAGGGLHVVQEGNLELVDGERHVEMLEKGSFFGEDMLLVKRALFQAHARTDAIVLSIPGDVLNDIPIVQWKLLETLEKRLMCAAKRGPRSRPSPTVSP